MKIAYGGTRFVLLVGDRAIKVARFRPLRALWRLAHHALNRQVAEKLTRFAPDPLTGGVKYLLVGIIANRREWRLWEETHYTNLVPTIYSFWGLVNVQVRAGSVAPKELKVENPFAYALPRLDPGARHDLSKVENFGRHDGRVCLVDYGSADVTAILSRKRRMRVAHAIP